MESTATDSVKTFYGFRIVVVELALFYCSWSVRSDKRPRETASSGITYPLISHW